MSYPTIPLTLIVLLVFASHMAIVKRVNGHSYLLDPKGDFKSFKKAECKLGGASPTSNDSCAGPCISKSSWQYEKDPKTTTYRRGQLVTLTWPRNNHKGGFVRITIVPEHLRMDRDAHTQLAFHFTCYESGARYCDYPECGTDANKIVLSTQIRIPTIYTDGNYVLGWSWYGGVSFDQSSLFGDYWSCANIRIKGGPPRTKTFPRVFHPGNIQLNATTVGTNSCFASVDDVGICKRVPCLGRTPTFMVPAQFSARASPSPISDFWTTSPPHSHSPTTASTPTTSESMIPSLRISPTGLVSLTTTPAPSSSISIIPSLSTSPTRLVSPTRTPPPSSATSITPSVLPSPIPPQPVISFPSLMPPGSMAAIVTPSPLTIPSLYPDMDFSPTPEASDDNAANVFVTNLQLVDASTKTMLTDTFFRTIPIPSNMTKITFVAETTGTTSTVKFYLNSQFVNVEYHEPFVCFGNYKDRYNYWRKPTFNEWFYINVSATTGSPHYFLNHQVYWMRFTHSDI